MAQLKDLIVTGATRLIGDVFTNKVLITSLADSAGNTGTNGLVLKSNGTNIVWGSDNNSFSTITISGSGNVITEISASGSVITATKGTMNNYTHPSYTAHNAAAVKVGNDATGHVVIGAALTYSDVGAASASHGTHVSYGTSAAAVGTTASAGSASTVSRSDHVHSIALATGDSNGQVKIAGTNVSVKGLGSAAYSATSSFAAASHGTHVSYGTSAAAVGTTANAGSATTVSRSDHVHNIALATGDSNGQVKIAGTNVSVKGLGSAAYSATSAFATAGHTHSTLTLFGKTYNGGSAVTVTSADVGLSGSMTFRGKITSALTDDSTANVILEGTSSNMTRNTGDVVIDTSGDEYVWNGSKWVKLGFATDFALKLHTHDLAIAADNGTNALTLNASTKYKITAGGSSFIFTTPPNTTYSAATTAANGLMTKELVTKLNGIATGANAYSLPTATTAVKGGIKVGTGLSISSETLSVSTSSGTSTLAWNSEVTLGTVGGLAIKAKLPSNPNTWNANAVNTAGYVAAPTTSNANKVWKTDANGNPAWRDDANTTYSAATTSTAGLMSAADKTKLNGIATGANAYSLPVATNDILGGVKTGFLLSGKNYAVLLDTNNRMYVYVPWTDNNTWASNSVTRPGIVAAPTTSNANRVWKTDASGNPAWRDEYSAFKAINTSVTSATWTTNTSSAELYDVGYIKLAAVLVSGCSTSSYPSVVFSYSDIASGNFAPICLSGDGVIYIYAIKAPSSDIILQSVCYI